MASPTSELLREHDQHQTTTTTTHPHTPQRQSRRNEDPVLTSPPSRTSRLVGLVNNVLDTKGPTTINTDDLTRITIDPHNDHYEPPPSPCATATSATTTPSASRRIDYSFSGGSAASSSRMSLRNGRQQHNHSRQYYTSSNSATSTFMPPMSPSRKTLDPEYAKRLFNQDPNNEQRFFERTDTGHDSRGQPIFRTPQGSFNHGEQRGEDVFFTPERGLTHVDTSTVVDDDDEAVASRSLFHHPGEKTPSTRQRSLSPSRYYTPHASPVKKRDVGSSVTPTNRRKSKWSSVYSMNANAIHTPDRKKNGGTVTSSPQYSDRFIPSRVSSNLKFSVWNDGHDSGPSRSRTSDGGDNNGGIGGGGGANGGTNVNDGSSTGVQTTGSDGSSNDGDPSVSGDGTSSPSNQYNGQTPILNALLRSELLGENIDPTAPSSTTSSNGMGRQRSVSPTRRSNGRVGATNFLRYNTASRESVLNELNNFNDPTSIVNSFNLTPVGTASSNRLSSMPQKRKRRIAKVPFKVLDAPALADDFYLNLVDWSSQNVLAVGLGSCVYLWSACTSKVTKLCDLGTNSQDVVTSVSWTQRGVHLAVGVNNGQVQIWDTIKCKKIRSMGGHSARIGALSWSGPTLASGSRDRLIYLRDVRVQAPFTARLASHKQEVCGLKWSFDEPAHLASGGNDNKLLVWDIKNHRQPAHKFAEHTAAVKAIAWSPHQHGLLASGGGTADRCIRFWNALSGSALNAVDTGSQVCNLAWSQNCNEIVSTHGYSLNQIAIWKYPTMQKVATLTGHTYRVLYLAMSPDGSTIVTGAGDETLRFWQVFPGPRSNGKTAGNGLLFPSSPGSILR